MKGSIRIGGALVLAILIVGVSLYSREKSFQSLNAEGTMVTQTFIRGYIEPIDSDGDGISDWEENLAARTFDAIATPTSSAEKAEIQPYEEPTTFTGKFSEAFFKDYLEGKMAGRNYSDDPTELVDKAVAAIETNATSKRYSPSELIIDPDATSDVREYGNKIMQVVIAHATTNENEAEILKRALDANDQSILEDLRPIRKAYEGMISGTLLLPVPQPMIQSHIELLNAYEGILTDIKAMQVAFEDPLLGLARIRLYETDAKALYAAFQGLNREFGRRGIIYTKDEPGSYFNYFGI